MFKINWKFVLKKITLFLIFIILLYSRSLNLSWGLPYPMHPDERNMAISIQNLNCGKALTDFKIERIKECFNPHFFAYGQLPLFIGYLVVLVLKLLDGDLDTLVSFSEAVFSLRLVSLISSLLNFWIILKIINLILRKENNFKNLILAIFLIIFAPFFIQFSHFGTTESLLMLLYSLLVYFALKFFLLEKNKIKKEKKLIFYLGFLLGLACAVKISSLAFSLPVFFIIFYKNFLLFPQKFFLSFKNGFLESIFFVFISIIFFIIFSPYNLLAFNEFLTSLNYESGVALGRYKVFYTRQFENTIPILFQLTKIFPQSLGWVNYLAWLGFFILSWKKKEINILRLFFLTFFLPNAFLFAKWTRFMAPVMPILLIFAILTVFKIKDYWFNFLKKILTKKALFNQRAFFFFRYVFYFFFFIFYILLLIPGLAYLSVYKNLDSRFEASLWINKNLPQNSFILSETANIVEIPFVLPLEKADDRLANYKYVSFNFYDLDRDLELKEELAKYLNSADYIIVPSRRIFANHFCRNEEDFRLSFYKNHCDYLKKNYPLLNQYYFQLFNEKLGYKKIKEFNSFPKIEIFGKKIVEFNDENAEETWSVFDHPVIRVYEKLKSREYQN